MRAARTERGGEWACEKSKLREGMLADLFHLYDVPRRRVVKLFLSLVLALLDVKRPLVGRRGLLLQLLLLLSDSHEAV